MTTYHFPSFTHITGMTHFLGLRLCFTQTGLNKFTFWLFSKYYNFYCAVISKGDCADFEYGISTYQIQDLWVVWPFFLSQCVASTPAFVQAMCFSTYLLLSEWTQHSKHCALVCLLQHVSTICVGQNQADSHQHNRKSIVRWRPLSRIYDVKVRKLSLFVEGCY